MEPKRDLALVLRSFPYEERHRVVTAITENHGVIAALAKNSIQSRRFGGALELFTASEWIFTQRPGSELVHLTEAHVRMSFDQLPQNFDRLSLASTFNELILRMAPQGDSCLELFKLHSNALYELNEAAPSFRTEIILLNAYFGKMLQWSGSQPQLHACLRCKVSLDSVMNSIELDCRVTDAGWICTECRSGNNAGNNIENENTFENSALKLTPLSIRDFQMYLSTPIRQVVARTQASPREHQQLFRFLHALYLYHIPGFEEKPLKSLRFLKSFFT